jgi:malonyl-CoA O-methyltransferase
MRISSEFSKYAVNYDSHNIIQNKIAHRLISKLSARPRNILDLGCGSGALCKLIGWEYQSFTGIDFAQGMLELHPKSDKVTSMYGDFNDKHFFEKLSLNKYDYIL